MLFGTKLACDAVKVNGWTGIGSQTQSKSLAGSEGKLFLLRVSILYVLVIDSGSGSF